jgi:hypothetical protein
MVVITPASMPSARCSTWITGTTQLVVQEAADTMRCSRVSCW